MVPIVPASTGASPCGSCPAQARDPTGTPARGERYSPGKQAAPGQPAGSEQDAFTEDSDVLAQCCCAPKSAPDDSTLKVDRAAESGPRRHTAWSTPSSNTALPPRRIRLTASRCVHLLVHGLALMLLVASDMVFRLSHRHDWQGDAVFHNGVALGLLYVSSIAWLLVHHMAPAEWLSVDGASPILRHSFFRGTASILEPVAFAMLHTVTAFVSSWWRQALHKNLNPGARAVCIAGILQLLLAKLYTIEGVGLAALPLLSFLALVALEVLDGASWGTVLDDALLQAFACVTCVVVAPSKRCRLISLDSQKHVHGQLREILEPILTEQFQSSHAYPIETRLDQLVSRLEAAKGAAYRSTLDHDLHGMLGAAFRFLLNELRHMSSLGPVMMCEPNTPPMTVEFVQKTLDQDVTTAQSPRQRLGSARSKPSSELTEDGSLSKLRSSQTIRDEQHVPNQVSLPVDDLPSEVSSSLPTTDIPEVFTFNSNSWKDLPRVSGTPTPGLQRQRSKLGTAIMEEGKSPANDRKSVTFKQGLAEMVDKLRSCQRKEFLAPPKLSDELNSTFNKRLGAWRFDIFKLEQLTGGRPLVVVGNSSVAGLVQKLELQSVRVSRFLDSIETRYNTNPYHNSTHGADVLNSMQYFLGFLRLGGDVADPMECLAALVAAGSHDVGHDGLSNGFHLAAETALSRLYNDQSSLESMHCSITFSVLREDSCNFLKDLPAAMRASFRAWVILMILETDLSKHVQSLSRFKQDFMTQSRDPSLPSTPARRRELAAFVLKCCDVAHGAKPFGLHSLWTVRICDEFFKLGDTERELGLACSPFCDRTLTHVTESQAGFFDFIISPLYTTINEYFGICRVREEVLPEMHKNRYFWNNYDDREFNYTEPRKAIHSLSRRFMELNKPTSFSARTTSPMPYNREAEAKSRFLSLPGTANKGAYE